MCVICKKFKKGTLSIQEAKEQLEEQMEFLSEDHIEEMENMLFEAEDTYEYMMDTGYEQLDEDLEYPLEEDLSEVEEYSDEDE